jgi:phage gpG-like protein
MDGVTVQSKLRGDREVLEALAELARGPRRMRTLMKRIGERVLVPSFKTTLATQGRGKWVPERRPVKKHRMLGGEGKIARGLAVVATDRKVLAGTTSGFGPWAQDGFTAQIPAEQPKRKRLMRLLTNDGVRFTSKVKAHTTTVPKREFLVLQDEDERAIVGETTKYLDRIARRQAKAGQA